MRLASGGYGPASGLSRLRKLKRNCNGKGSIVAAKVDPELCAGCGDCVDACPTEAITLTDDGIAVVDEDLCSDCAACVDVCPSEAITIE